MADRDHQLREDRHDTDDAATVWRQSGAAVHGKLVNISNKGCRVRHRKTLWIGERVVLELHGKGPMPAIVIWSMLGNSGFMFSDRHEADLAR
jgi:hypothetical protein